MNSISAESSKLFDFSSLPTVLKGQVLSFIDIDPTNPDVNSIKGTAREVITIMDKGSREVFDKKIQKLFTAYAQLRLPELNAKYNAYDSTYEDNCETWNRLNDPSFSSDNLDPEDIEDNQKFLEDFNPIRPPQLLDALSTDCRLPRAEYSIKKYTPEIEKDIQDLVRMIPESLNYRRGETRLRSRVSPLGMACLNPNIPVHLVEWLFKHGANPNEIWGSMNNSSRQVRIFDCLKSGFDFSHVKYERIQALIQVFLKYGAEPKRRQLPDAVVNS